MSRAILLALVSAAACAPAVSAETPLSVAPFNAVELQDGGQVTIRPGPAQRVILVEGDAGEVRAEVEGGRLRLRKCRTACSHRGRLRIEIVTPQLESLAVRDGGIISVERGFAPQPTFAASVFSGGAIDMRGVAADSVAASIDQGGVILARPAVRLDAAVNQGGRITYWGDPRVRSSIRRGGVVERGRPGDADRPIADLEPLPLPPVPPLPPSKPR